MKKTLSLALCVASYSANAEIRDFTNLSNPSTPWNKQYINPNQIPLRLSIKDKVCTVDFDQDGDLDIINYYHRIITLQLNIGSLTTPLFATERILSSRANAFQLNELKNKKITCNQPYSSTALVDIDNDRDLDKFVGHQSSAQTRLPFSTPFTFFKNTNSELIKQDDSLGLPGSARTMVFTDIDEDGDIDFFSKYHGFYLNIGSAENPFFIQQDKTPMGVLCDSDFQYDPPLTGIGAIVDINGDDQLDMICKQNTVILSSTAGYAKNTHIFQSSSHSDITYGYKISTLDINGGKDKLKITYQEDGKKIKDLSIGGKILPFSNKRDLKKRDEIFQQCNIPTNEASRTSFLIDFDGDSDLDLFAKSGKYNDETFYYCEHKGNPDNSSFSSHTIVDVPNQPIVESSLSLGDIDSDGDQDMMLSPAYTSGHTHFHENIGTPEQPLFQYIGNIINYGQAWVDLDGDGKLESSVFNSTLLNKGVEPATDINAVIQNGNLIIAVNRPSQLHLYSCSLQLLGGACSEPTILPFAVSKISLSSADFTKTLDGNEIALASIDHSGLMTLSIYDSNLNLISQRKGNGISALALSISAGQLDNDTDDEIALVFAQVNGEVIAASINFDMSIISATKVGFGTQPSVSVGNFSNSNGSYILSYINNRNHIQIAIVEGNGTLVNQYDMKIQTRYAKISKASFLPSTPQDEYVVSYDKDFGVELAGFSADGTRLGKLASDKGMQEPNVSSGFFTSKNIHGLAASVIQNDKKPAVIFIDNQGRYLGTGVGKTSARVATAIIDSSKYPIGDGILVYISEEDIPIWNIFNADGTEVMMR